MTQDITQKAAVGILPYPTLDVIKSGIVSGIAPGIINPISGADVTLAIAAHVAQPDPHIQYQLESQEVLDRVPVGDIIGCYGPLVGNPRIPPNYAICNGIDNAPGPDLTSEFVI